LRGEAFLKEQRETPKVLSDGNVVFGVCGCESGTVDAIVGGFAGKKNAVIFYLLFYLLFFVPFHLFRDFHVFHTDLHRMWICESLAGGVIKTLRLPFRGVLMDCVEDKGACDSDSDVYVDSESHSHFSRFISPEDVL